MEPEKGSIGTIGTEVDEAQLKRGSGEKAPRSTEEFLRRGRSETPRPSVRSRSVLDGRWASSPTLPSPRGRRVYLTDIPKPVLNSFFLICFLYISWHSAQRKRMDRHVPLLFLIHGDHDPTAWQFIIVSYKARGITGLLDIYCYLRHDLLSTFTQCLGRRYKLLGNSCPFDLYFMLLFFSSDASWHLSFLCVESHFIIVFLPISQFSNLLARSTWSE